MSELQTDEAVLAVVNSSWKKVALIIAEAAHKLGSESALTEEGAQLIASRIEALIHDGRLEAQGNTIKWRTSEVRRRD